MIYRCEIHGRRLVNGDCPDCSKLEQMNIPEEQSLPYKEVVGSGNQPIGPELISIDHSEGELPVDGLLDEQSVTVSEDELWDEVESWIVTFTGSTKMEAVRLCQKLKGKYTLLTKQHQ